MTLDTLQAGGCTIHILAVIKGLKSEADKVREAFEQVKPDKVALSISKEELDGLRNLPDDYEPELSRYEEIYADGLSRFGEVAAPPPCYVAAVELADHSGAELLPVDMDEGTYTDLYCAAVPGTTLFRHSTRTWLLRRRRFSDKSPEEFVLAWDRAVNNLEGFGMIERKRAEAMAKGIADAIDGCSRLLAVIELERAAEVAQLIRERNNKKK